MMYDKTVFIHPLEGASLPANTVSVENPLALVNVRDTKMIQHFKEAYKKSSLPSHLDSERLELLSSLLTKDGLDRYTDELHQEAVNIWVEHLYFDNDMPPAPCYQWEMLLPENRRHTEFSALSYDRGHT